MPKSGRLTERIFRATAASSCVVNVVIGIFWIGVVLRMLTSTVQVLLSFSPFLVTAYSQNNNQASVSKVPHHLRPHHVIFQQIAHQTTCPSSNNINRNNCIWIDMENVRGKSGFELTHKQVLDKTATWINHFGLQDQVVIVIDHGEESAFYLQRYHMAVAFSGNHAKADDVIVKGVATSSEWMYPVPQEGTGIAIPRVGKIIVVTADHELQGRCRRAAKIESLHILNPQTFLDDLEWVSEQQQQQLEQVPMKIANNSIKYDDSTVMTIVSPLSWNDQLKLGRLDSEIRLRGQLLNAELQLDRRRSSGNIYMTKKRRKKLESAVQAFRRKLALRGPSLLDQLSVAATVDDNDESGNDDTSRMPREDQDMLLARWRELQHRHPRKEQTGDRVIYAEKLRRQFEDDVNAQMLINKGFEHSEVLSSAKAFVRFINRGVLQDRARRQQPQGLRPSLLAAQHVHFNDENDIQAVEMSTQQRLAYQNQEKFKTLDLVVISDTHGFEGQFDHIIQSGDVLFHLGDFALEGSFDTQQQGLVAFDRWLARQSHDYKIVIRGNHDPFTYDFPFSKALYVTKPTSINIGGFEMALIPHGSPRKLAAAGGIPPTCDVIASHVPPYKTLDRTYTGKFAGSSFLCNVVRGMPMGPPPLWLVGHIHEGRGVARRQFGRSRNQETLVINASNANHGHATHLMHGPVAVRLQNDNPTPQILVMDDMSINQAPSSQYFFQTTDTDDTSQEDDSNNNNNHLLLAVDLGLKSGVSLFSSDGKLVRYEQFQFERDSLERSIPRMIRQWEDQAGDCCKVTHLAIEGGDTALLGMWERATPGISTLRVRPEEWRAELLTWKENKNGASAKAASRLIARQMVTDFGIMEEHCGKFPTDMAESVLLGTHVARRLGWIQREPAVRRYTNGNVVTPKKAVINAKQIHNNKDK
jgi:predicted phosphodiesterase